MSVITNTRKERIFVEMFNKNANNFVNNDKLIIITFEDTNPNSKFSYLYADAKLIESVINANVGITYSIIKNTLPHLYLQMISEDQYIKDINNMLNDKWSTKYDDDLVFLCIYPAGLDKIIESPQHIKDLLSGCFDISVYRIIAD